MLEVVNLTAVTINNKQTENTAVGVHHDDHVAPSIRSV
jgi:hypothetical protein